MDQFVRALMAQPPLSPAEEQALARQARAGDPTARAALITSGLRSVALRARLLGLRGEELRDAVQSGSVGLIRAVDRFDPDRGVRLATYAWRWIGAEMTPAAARAVELGDNQPVTDRAETGGCDLLEGLDDVAIRVLTLRFALTDQVISPMSRQSVAEHLGLSISQVRTVEAKAMRQLRGRLANVVHRAPHQ
nr:hypothetical protein [Aeromicrobium sp.]